MRENKEYNAQWRADNKDHIRDYHAQWRAKNRDKCRTYRERLKAAQPDYHKNKRRTLTDEQKARYAANNKAWRERNPDKVKLYNSQAYRKKRPNYTKRPYKWKPHKPKPRHAFINAVKEHCGCMNPGCCWRGPLPPYCLEFHHKDPADKLFNIGAGVRGKALTIKEMRKCIVLCSNCHRQERYGELDVSAIEPCRIDDHGQYIAI